MTPDEHGRRIVRQTLRAGSADPGPYGDLCRACLDDDHLEWTGRLNRLGGAFDATARRIADVLGSVTHQTISSMEQMARSLGLPTEEGIS